MSIPSCYPKTILRLFSGEKIKSFMDLLTKHMPPPTNYEREVADAYVPNSPLALPNTLRAAIRLFPDAKVLTEDVQEVTVAIDIEGTLHNQRSLSETAIDVVFVVDNGQVQIHRSRRCKLTQDIGTM